MSIGSVVGNYKISQEIGHGGMGKVFKAIHLSLERVVAIKMVHPKLISNEDMVARFYSEAKIQARLNHPNIVAVYDFFEFEDNHYIIMEYVEGESVSQIISHQGPFDIEYGTQIFLQILDGISYAHSKNVIHKDIKTSNFILTPKSVKITDFGIAQIIDESNQSNEKGGVIGTPKYMSPEMILGKKVDHSTDIYSLGITYFEFLTGNVPFGLSKKTDFEIRKAQIELPPPPPSSLNPKIPKEIENIILKSLEKKAKNRFQSVQEFIDAIKNIRNIKSNEIEINLDDKTESQNGDRYIEIKEIDISIPQDNISDEYDFSGKLEDTNFAKLLSKFHHEKSLGHLILDSDINLKVYFYEGFVQFVECDDPNLLLGKLLVENKTISLKDQKKAIEYTGESGLKIGEALIKLGKITPHELSNILELQIKLKLLNGFCCEKGFYGFQYSDETEVDTIFRVDPIQVIYEAVDRHYIFNEENVDNSLNLEGQVIAKDTLEGKIKSINFSSVKEIRLANMVKDQVEISKIIENSPLDRQETFKFLKFLDLADLISIDKSYSTQPKKSGKNQTMILDPLGDKTVVLSESIIKEQIGEELKKI